MSAKWVDPTKLTLADLVSLATALLKPNEGERVVIGMMTAEVADEASAVEPEPIVEEVSNVIPIFPSLWQPSEYQKEQQEATRTVLDMVAEEVRLGKLRECIVILGVEPNAERINDAVIWMTRGVMNDMTMFLGAIEECKDRLRKMADAESDYMEVYDED